MERQSKSDLRINGLGSSSGGTFNYVQINGKGEISGDLNCSELQINGLGSVDGNVKATSVRIAGKSDIGGDLTGERIVIDGLVEIRGKVSAEHLENRGALRISGDCGAESFKSTGGFTIGGLLNSEKIEIEVYASCTAREIGGESVDVRRGRGFGIKDFIDSILPGLTWKKGLSVETIEGDNIFIEDTTAKVVRGSDVRVGTGCSVESVEYKNTFVAAPDAIVKRNRKV